MIRDILRDNTHENVDENEPIHNDDGNEEDDLDLVAADDASDVDSEYEIEPNELSYPGSDDEDEEMKI